MFLFLVFGVMLFVFGVFVSSGLVDMSTIKEITTTTIPAINDTDSIVRFKSMDEIFGGK